MLLCCKREHCACIQTHYTASFVLFSFVSCTFSELFCSLPLVFSPLSGPSLSSSGRTCPWPLPHSENAEARLLSPTHSFSALLEVRCKPGFTLPSGMDATIRRCQGDRQWSGDEPICTGRFEVTGKCSLVRVSSWQVVVSWRSMQWTHTAVCGCICETRNPETPLWFVST